VDYVRDKLHFFIAWDVINTSAAYHHLKKKEDITDDLETDTEIIEFDLGKKQKWIATGETPSGKIARRKLDTDILVTMRATCMILAHRHKLIRR